MLVYLHYTCKATLLPLGELAGAKRAALISSIAGTTELAPASVELLLECVWSLVLSDGYSPAAVALASFLTVRASCADCASSV